MSDLDETPFELHSRQFLCRSQKLRETFCAFPGQVRSVLQELDRYWPQIQTAFAWAEHRHETSQAAAELCVEFASCAAPGGGDSPLVLRQSPRESRRWIEAGLASARHLGWQWHQAGLLYHLASTAAAEYQFTEARDYGEQALRLFRELDERRLAGIVSNLLGLVEIASGDIDAAMTRFQESLAVFRTLGLDDDVAFTLGAIAQAHLKGGHFDEALQYAIETRELSRAQGRWQTELDALKTMASVFAKLGNREDLDSVCDEAIALAEQKKSESPWTTWLGRIDLIRLGMTEAGESPLRRLEQDLMDARELGDWNSEGFALVALGLARIMHGDRESGRICLEEACTIFGKHEYALGLAVSRKYLDMYFTGSP